MKIYHFTTAARALEILNSGKLFLSDVACANDSSEGNYGRKLIEKYILENYKSKKEAGFLTSLVNINTPHRDDLGLFVTCFTKEVCNSFSWMVYGDYGAGAALKFDSKKLYQAVKNKDPFVKIGDVVYDDKRQRAELEKVKKKAEKAAGTTSDGYDFDVALKKARFFLGVYPFFKHPAYRCEHEKRVAIVCGRESLDNPNAFKGLARSDDAVIDLENITGLTRASLLLKNLFAKGAFEGVVLGGNIDPCYKEKIESAVEKNYGEKLHIIHSTIPMRRKEN